MSRTFFDRSQNLQIQGDLTLVSSGGSRHDDPGFFHISQRVQASNAQSRAIERGFKILCDNTAPSARYGSGESFTGPQCHPGTRIAVQDYIFKWLDDPDGQIAMWMNGPVGIGKSAIAQTVAHLAAERGQLSSAFFFSRSDDSRNTVKYLVPTLAYEMTQRMPHTLHRVCQTIAPNPHLFSASLDYQISSTLLRPLCIPCESSLRGRMLIVIDGVDECLDTKDQQAIIRSFILGFVRVAEETIPHKILIVSRPESHIASAVLAADINPHVRSLALESWNTEDDIEIFLRSKFIDIQQTHPLRHHLPCVWPSDASFRWLRERSVGSFAYASVAIRFLASHNNNPERALQDLLLLRPNRAAVAFADLDALYRHILLSLDEKTRFILQKILCLYLYTTLGDVNFVTACLSEDESMVELALLHVSSLIHIHRSGWRYIRFYHTSFVEFLRDRERSGDLYVFSPNVASVVAHALSSLCLHPLSDMDEYQLFRGISKLMSQHTPNIEMYLHVFKTLVETGIPASFLHPFSGTWESNRVAFHEACQSVMTFVRLLLALMDQLDSDSTHQTLYNNAYNVICAWLRSHFNLFFHRAPTPNDILDILLEDWHNEVGIGRERYPFLFILYDLTGRELLYCIIRIFPDIDRGEIFSRILERYLALPSDARMRDYESIHLKTLTVPVLYTLVLNLGGRLPRFCQKLEQIVLMGQRALGAVPVPYVTPRDYIFRVLYGDDCYIDNEYQIAVGNQKVSDIIKSAHGFWSYEVVRLFIVAGRTDRYIRLAHTEQDFAYISEDVEFLYRTASPVFLEDREREEFWEYYEVKEL